MDIVICDDEIQYVNDVECICKDYYGSKVSIRKFMSGKELLDNKSNLDNSLLFLDIELGDVDGIGIKDALECKNIHNYIVFVTGYSDFIYKAFGKNVMGYIKKPINKSEIVDILDKINKLEKLNQKIEIKYVSGEVNMVVASDIKYINSQHIYTQVALSDNSDILTRKSLAEWDELLDETAFVRVNKSYIVNLEHVDSISSSILYLDDDFKIKIPKGKVRVIKEKFWGYIRAKARRI